MSPDFCAFWISATSLLIRLSVVLLTAVGGMADRKGRRVKFWLLCREGKNARCGGTLIMNSKGWLRRCDGSF